MQLLYSLGSDFNPYNGFKIEVSSIKQSNISKKFRATQIFNLDTLNPDSDEYTQMVKTYRLDLIDISEALKTEMHIELGNAMLTTEREYRYLIGDVPIVSSHDGFNM